MTITTLNLNDTSPATKMRDAKILADEAYGNLNAEATNARIRQAEVHARSQSITADNAAIAAQSAAKDMQHMTDVTQSDLAKLAEEARARAHAAVENGAKPLSKNEYKAVQREVAKDTKQVMNQLDGKKNMKQRLHDMGTTAIDKTAKVGERVAGNFKNGSAKGNVARVAGATVGLYGIASGINDFGADEKGKTHKIRGAAKALGGTLLTGVSILARTKGKGGPALT